MKLNKHLPLIGAVLLAAVTLPTTVLAAPPADPAPKSTSAVSARPYPFRGTIARVDIEARTVTLESRTTPRVLRIGEQSVLEKDGKPAVLTEIRSGDYLRGQIRKTEEGHETIVKAVAGPRPSREDARSTATNGIPRT